MTEQQAADEQAILDKIAEVRADQALARSELALTALGQLQRIEVALLADLRRHHAEVAAATVPPEPERSDAELVAILVSSILELPDHMQRDLLGRLQRGGMPLP